MARTDNLSNYLTDIADAIREKKSSVEEIPANNFDTEIESIPTGITPTGTIEITENGLNDVTNYAEANVNVAGGGVDEYFDTVVDKYNYSKFGQDVLVKKVPTITVREGAQYAVNMFSGCSYLKAINIIIPEGQLINTSYMFDSCSNLESVNLFDTSNVTTPTGMFSRCAKLISVPAFDFSSANTFASLFYYCRKLESIPQLNAPNITSVDSMFYYCNQLKTVPVFDTSNVTQMQNIFNNCSSLEIAPSLDTSKVINASSMFYSCTILNTIPELDFSSCTNISNILVSCQNVVNVGGFKNLGQAYSTTVSANNSAYLLRIYSQIISRESLLNIINNLYDIASKGCNTQKLQIGNTNINKLTSEEIAIATSRGWTVC